MANGSSPLTLKYLFIPSPDPIRASAGGSNPNHINLQVIINNPTLDPVTLREITIAIPMGEEDSRCLSASPDLPSPKDKSSPKLSISSSGGTVTISARDGAPFQLLGASIDFTLKDIQVNRAEGTVPLTVTEFFPPSAPKAVDDHTYYKAVDDHTYYLRKWPADRPIIAFYAEPATLTDLDQSATLHWTCSDQGKGYVYSVHSRDWQPKDCLESGNCYQWDDGVKGVKTPDLDETTRFYLDVIEAVPDGDREIHATLSTTVQVVVPRMVDAAVADEYLSGRIVLLTWKAENATSCTILLDRKPIVKDAPVHTHKHPYPVVLTGDPGLHTIRVIAQDAMSKASSSPKEAGYVTLYVTIGAPVDVTAGKNPRAIAITPDGKLALVAYSAYYPSGNVTVIDIARRQAEPTPIPVGHNPEAIAITPDGTLALVANCDSSNVTVIDIAKRQAEPTPLSGVDGPYAIAITPDGRLALVANYSRSTVTVIDLARRQAEPTPIPVGAGPIAIAITPDGTLALVANRYNNNVTVIDIAKRQAEPTPLYAGEGPSAIAITRDGTLALVANRDSNNVTVIDLAKRRADSTPIPVGSYPWAIAMTRDGKIALVANFNSNTVTVIDVTRRQAVLGTIPIGSGPIDIAITRDGTLALVANSSGNVTVI